jgi:hypothetical protein
VRLLSHSPGQYRDVDTLAEVFVGGHGPADLLGKGWPLIWGGQLRHPERGVHAADELVEVQLGDVIDGGGEHLEPGRGQVILLAPLALLVGAAGERQLGAQPVFQVIAQRPGPAGVLQPQRRPVGHHRDTAARA